MADEFEVYRKRSYHGGYDHCSVGDNNAQDESKTVSFRVPPLKRSRSHPIGRRAKTQRGISPSRRSARVQGTKSTDYKPFFYLCHKNGCASPDLNNSFVRHVLHTSFHSLVLLPKVGIPGHVCPRCSPQISQHRRIIKTPPSKARVNAGRKSSAGDINRDNTSLPRMKERTVSLQPVSGKGAFNVSVIGTQGVGKATLVRTFATADDANVSTDVEDCLSGAHVSIMGDGRDDSLILTSETIQQFEDRQTSEAYVVVYAVNDKHSFEEAVNTVKNLRNKARNCDLPIILAANKGDMVRNRAVKSKEGRDLAAKYRCKYVEVSALLNINVDELFLGVLAQLHFARERTLKKISSDSNMVVQRKPPIPVRAMGYIGKLLTRYREYERDIDNLFSP